MTARSEPATTTVDGRSMILPCSALAAACVRLMSSAASSSGAEIRISSGAPGQAPHWIHVPPLTNCRNDSWASGMTTMSPSSSPTVSASLRPGVMWIGRPTRFDRRGGAPPVVDRLGAAAPGALGAVAPRVLGLD
uniref:hypothetical protein n=1 Tax=Streptomyces griseus TaxID=1911 RepID=UPI001C4067CF